MVQATRTCLQEFVEKKESVHPAIMSLAVFARGALWSAGDTITISFLKPDTTLEWEYSLEDLAGRLSDADMDLERRARGLGADYAGIVRLVIEERVAPVVPTLHFKFVDRGGDVRVRFNSAGGSSSLVGTGCKASAAEYTLTLGWLDVGTIIHEFSHALGMLHELQNPAAQIPWNEAAVYEYYASTNGWDKKTTYENVLKPDASNQVSNSSFDASSVMVYPVPASLTKNGFHTDINLRYSATDIQWLGEKYDVPAATIQENIAKFAQGAPPLNGGGAGPAKSRFHMMPIYVLIALAILIVIFLFI